MNTPPRPGPLAWLRAATPPAPQTLLAGSLGWLLDAFDVMLYALVLTHLIAHFGMDKATAGFLNSLTLFASALGGALFGFLADRVGRTRALMGSILVYSLAGGAGGRELAGRAPRQSPRADAVELGDRGRPGGGHRGVAPRPGHGGASAWMGVARLARGLLRRRAPGAAGLLGAAAGAGAGDLARPTRASAPARARAA